jgi:hypothetical protein
VIISHKHRYLFVELHHTASTAISCELRANYDGEPVLFKHAAYSDFLRVANSDEREYFAFSCVRHPMDSVASQYWKYRHSGGRLSDLRSWKRGLGRVYYALFVRRRYRYVSERGADFATYFLRYYHLPYDDWSSLDHKEFDYLIRFENLQEDFCRVLNKLGIEPQQPLPQVNRTSGKDPDFMSYYTAETRDRARWVFGPHMQKWDYDFPVEWGEQTVHPLSLFLYHVLAAARRPYWRYLRPGVKGWSRSSPRADARNATSG